MRKWEYLWIYVDDSSGTPVYAANGERLPAQTYPEVLNIAGYSGQRRMGISSRCSAERLRASHAYIRSVVSEAADS